MHSNHLKYEVSQFREFCSETAGEKKGGGGGGGERQIPNKTLIEVF